MQMLTQMPPEWFQDNGASSSSDDGPTEIRGSCIKTVLSLIKSCHSVIKMRSDVEADGKLRCEILVLIHSLHRIVYKQPIYIIFSHPFGILMCHKSPPYK